MTCTPSDWPARSRAVSGAVRYAVREWRTGVCILGPEWIRGDVTTSRECILIGSDACSAPKIKITTITTKKNPCFYTAKTL